VFHSFLLPRIRFLAGVGYDALRLERTVARQRRRASVNLECSIFTWLTAPGPPPSSPSHLLVGQAIWNHGSSPRADGFHEANVTTAGERMQGLHRKLSSYRAQHSTNSTPSSVRPFYRCSLESIVGLESTRYHGSALLSRRQVGRVSLGRSATQVEATTWHAWLPVIENSEPTVLSPGTLRHPKQQYRGCTATTLSPRYEPPQAIESWVALPLPGLLARDGQTCVANSVSNPSVSLAHA
jgi:hypothetical protein